MMRTGAALLLALLILAVLPVAAQAEPAPSLTPDLTVTPAGTTSEMTPIPPLTPPVVTTPEAIPTQTPALSPPDMPLPRGPVVQAPPPSLDVSVDPAAVSFGGGGVMRVPATYHAWVNVTVQAQGVQNWFLRAEDITPLTAHKGFLSSTSPARNLSRPLEIWDFTLVPAGFRAVGPGNSVWYTSTKPGKSEVITRFRQGTATDDLYGVYTMTVSFTASTS
jgi:hypothetical protein